MYVGDPAPVRDEPRSVSEIADHFAITQQAVSLHLKVLREAGLVGMRRDGQRRLYLVDPGGMASLQDFLRRAVAGRSGPASNTPLKPTYAASMAGPVRDRCAYRTSVDIAATPEAVYPYLTRAVDAAL